MHKRAKRTIVTKEMLQVCGEELACATIRRTENLGERLVEVVGAEDAVCATSLAKDEPRMINDKNHKC